MARNLTSIISSQITNKDIKVTFILTIGSTVYTSELISWNISYNISFGAANAVFILDNNTGNFSDGGSTEIEVGDVVEFTEKFTGDSTEFKKFYGIVSQRSLSKQGGNRVITLNCLDYISSLQFLDIDLEVEGTRVDVTNELLVPNYLDAPNDDLAQLFNFANDSIATQPIPTIRIRDKNHTTNVESQWDGFEVLYSVGQLKLGSVLNVRNNYDVLSTYSYYSRGAYAEDVMEEIITLADGYGNFLFGESSAQAVIDNHLTDTFLNVEGSSTDILIPNLVSTSISIDTTLTSAVNTGDNSINVTSSSGFPTSGSGTINGDTFTWTGKTDTSLTGIPSSGSNSLLPHANGSYVKYVETYAAGQVWALSYDNLVTTLTSGDFTVPSGVSVNYVDKRYGRVILDTATSVTETVTCNVDYSFKTLAATGIEINRMIFRSREVANRLEAIKKVKAYLAPNYIIRTKGDDKIWASYLNQKTTADYNVNLVTRANYLEDEDLYTRVLMWAKNKQPTNIMFGDSVDYSSDTEDSYTGSVSKETLSYFGEEKSGELSTWANGSLSEAELLHQTSTQLLINYVKDKYINKDYASQDTTGYYTFGTTISDDRGKIILDSVTPIVYVNGVPIDNKIHQQVAVPVKVKQTTKTISEGGGKSKSVSVHTYYYYEVIFPHSSIVPDESIYLYNNQGILEHTIAANDPNVDYGNGIWTIPGIEQNDVAEILSTATYYVLYGNDKLEIEYDDVIFKIHKSILPEPESVTVSATFEYWSIAVGTRDIDAVVDGRRSTQLQIEFFGNPPADFHLATIDLGSSYSIQAIDIIGGFFKPDDTRKFDIGCSMTLKYSTDGVTFYSISDKTDNFSLSGGESVSFEEEDLGLDFEARYLKFNLQEVDKINYGRGRYVVAINEISAYSDIILEGESTLIATTALTVGVNAGDTEIYVGNTSGFTEAESGETVTAYIGSSSFTYTDVQSGNTFTGCTVESGVSGSIGDRVSQTLEGDTTLYDDSGLLPQLKDRVYKKVLISDRNLYTQSELDTLAKRYLEEFYKNHTKITIDVLYAPYISVGDTLSLTDSYNNVSDVKYFVESISDRNGFFNLVLARYPA